MLQQLMEWETNVLSVLRDLQARRLSEMPSPIEIKPVFPALHGFFFLPLSHQEAPTIANNELSQLLLYRWDN